MIFNPVIIAAIVVQGFISKTSKIAGAVVGYVITTGIMVWGLSLYGDGSQIALFGIPLSEEAFIIACLVWYGFDTKVFIAAKQESGEVISQSPIPVATEGAAALNNASGPRCYHCGYAISSQHAELCPQCGKNILGE
jgi:hypothetical protein